MRALARKWSGLLHCLFDMLPFGWEYLVFSPVGFKGNLSLLDIFQRT